MIEALTRALVLVATCACAARPATPATVPRAAGVAALGETLTVESKLLGEQRVINVYVPPDYGKGTARYPVLYMPDGGMTEDFPHVVGSVDVSIKNAVVRPVIVVGIQNTERRRDLVSATTIEEEKQMAPHAGGSDRFRAFLREELKPLIDRRYRTTAESAIIGESFAGLFVLETLLVEPTLFDGYIAVDPSVWWNAGSLVREASPQLAWWSAGPKRLYIATADYPDTQQRVEELVALLRIHAPPITWTYEPMPREHHNTIFPTAALHGIRTLFEATP